LGLTLVVVKSGEGKYRGTGGGGVTADDSSAPFTVPKYPTFLTTFTKILGT